MRDRRNELLERLAAVLSPLAPNFARNRGELPEDKRPGILLLDADEIFNGSLAAGKRGLSQAPNVVLLTPEIVIVLKDAKPDNATSGADLAGYRIAILAAVLFDQSLGDICGPNGGIQYQGCATDFGRNREMNGEMILTITFAYPFKPNETLAGG